jgi:hypothetical protein
MIFKMLSPEKNGAKMVTNGKNGDKWQKMATNGKKWRFLLKTKINYAKR